MDLSFIADIINSSSYYVKVGGYDFLKFFILLQYLYCSWRILDDVKHHYFLKTRPTLDIAKKVLRFVLLFNLMMLLSLGLLGGLIRVVYSFAEISQVAANNVWLMEIDKSIFGVYLPLWFHSSLNSYKPILDVVGVVFVTTFFLIAFVMSSSCAIILSLSARNFMRMVLALLLVIVISSPIWALLPALSPMQGVIDNVMRVELPAELVSYADTVEPNLEVALMLDQLREAQESESGARSMSITTIPSMHVGWATIIGYYGIRSVRKLMYLYLPYVFFTMIGTVYLMQHYFVDIPAGFLVAVAAIAISNAIVRKPPAFIAVMTEFIQEDRRRFTTYFKRLCTAFVKLTNNHSPSS